jgi:predicted metal-dependent hydrolase
LAPLKPSASKENRPKITVRDIRFGTEAVQTRAWLGGDVFATAFFNALSVTFPDGERFFMDSVRRFKNELPPKLAAEAAAFVRQEAMHSREHVGFNRLVAGQGYDVLALENRTRRRLALARSRAPRLQLAVTMALEHFTAILAHALLAHGEHIAGANAEAQAMWRWHAIEEIEHKAVAFDTYMAVSKTTPAPLRWLQRSMVMVISTALLVDTVGANMRDLLAQDGVRGWRAFSGTLHYLFVKPGIARQVAGLYFKYFLPGFHPWAHDDRALIKDAERDLSGRLPQEAFA